MIDLAAARAFTTGPHRLAEPPNSQTCSLDEVTRQLRFEHTVVAGEASGDVGYPNPRLLKRGAAVLDNMQRTVNLTLPSPGAKGSLSNTSALVVNTDTARIVSLESEAASGEYGAGSVLSFIVTFSHDVVVSGTPLLPLNMTSNSTLEDWSVRRRRAARRPVRNCGGHSSCGGVSPPLSPSRSERVTRTRPSSLGSTPTSRAAATRRTSRPTPRRTRRSRPGATRARRAAPSPAAPRCASRTRSSTATTRPARTSTCRRTRRSRGSSSPARATR